MSMNSWLSINKLMPLLDAPVIVKTSWATYLARLQLSRFGGKEFKVINGNHTIQLTTVVGWKLAK